MLFSRFHGLLRIFTPLPLAAPFTRRFFQNRTCNRSARVRSTVCIPSSRNTRPLHASCCVAGSHTPGGRTALSGLLCFLRTSYRRYSFGQVTASSNRLPPLSVWTGPPLFEPFSRLFIVKVGHCFFTPFVFSSYIFSMTNTGNIQ